MMARNLLFRPANQTPVLPTVGCPRHPFELQVKMSTPFGASFFFVTATSRFQQLGLGLMECLILSWVDLLPLRKKLSRLTHILARIIRVEPSRAGPSDNYSSQLLAHLSTAWQ